MTVFYSDFYSDNITELEPGYMTPAQYSGVAMRSLVGRVAIQSPNTTIVCGNSDITPATGDKIALVPVRSDWVIIDGWQSVNANTITGGGSLAVTRSLGLWRADNNGLPTSEIDKSCFVYQDTSLWDNQWSWPRDTDTNTIGSAELQRPIYDLPFTNPVGTPLSASKPENLVICIYFDLVTDWLTGPTYTCRVHYTEAG